MNMQSSHWASITNKKLASPAGLGQEQVITAWTIDYINVKHWDVVTHPCPEFNGGLLERRQG